MNQTEALIQQLGLMPHPEGGWYRDCLLYTSDAADE